jgi:hypothetical protein
MQKDIMKKLMLVVVGYVVMAVLLFLFVFFDVLSLRFYPGFDVPFSILKNGVPYFLATIVFLAMTSVFKIFYKGTFVPAVSNTLIGIATAFIVFFFFTIPPMPLLLQNLAVYFFFLIVLIAVYSLGNAVLGSRQQITFLALLRFSGLAVLGIILRFAVIECFGNGNTVVANILLFGFLFAAATALFYPLQYSKKSAFKKLGGWLGTGTLQKVILGMILAGYLLFFRSYLSQINSNGTMIGEWVFVGLLTIVAVYRLRVKLDVISAPLILESWEKHQQELGFKTSEEFVFLSKEVDAFLKLGEKKGVLLFLFNFLFSKKVSPNYIDLVLGELINYQDPPNPRLIFSWDAQLFEESKLQKRKIVLDEIIESLSPDVFRSNAGVD